MRQAVVLRCRLRGGFESKAVTGLTINGSSSALSHDTRMNRSVSVQPYVSIKPAWSLGPVLFLGS